MLLTPFVPVSSGNSITRLSSFLTAKSDPGSYGKLQSFVMPPGSNVDGPIQVSNQIDSTQQISQAVTLLNQQGSRVIKGSLQLIPVGNSIIYVRPFYVRSSSEGGFPKFQFVAVFTQDKGAVCAPDIDTAIERLFADTRRSAGDGVHHRAGGDRARPTPTATTTARPSSSSSDHHHDHAAGGERVGAGQARPGRGAVRPGRPGPRPTRTSRSTSSS